ncbi:hypothetical protein EUZ85_08100 [Hahella sp. KA22]|nr:hypothetical protein ENC22_05550 [Hahella sp. KA22]QAY54050.1 hypothetical protein EUZ85_08100 [Hahella sp. KA22]
MAESTQRTLIYTQASRRTKGLWLRDGAISLMTWMLWGYLLLHPVYYFFFNDGELMSPLLQLSLVDILAWAGGILAVTLSLYHLWSRAHHCKWWWRRRNLLKQAEMEMLGEG